jgi:hypothetical protein
VRTVWRICWFVHGLVTKSEAPERIPSTASAIDPQAVMRTTGRSGRRARIRRSRSIPSSPVVLREKFMSCRTSAMSSRSIRRSASSGPLTATEA